MKPTIAATIERFLYRLATAVERLGLTLGAIIDRLGTAIGERYAPSDPIQCVPPPCEPAKEYRLTGIVSCWDSADLLEPSPNPNHWER